jgi:putative ABC transport system ATP-binding protein
MLSTHQLTKYFNRGTASETLAADHISLHMADSEFAVIIGSNGSGKTTLLNLIAGSYLPDEGTLFIDGSEVTTKPDFKRSRWIARVFQDPLKGTAPELTILENFRLAALRTKPKGFRIGLEKKFRAAVAERISILSLGLESKLDTLVGKLSGGQRQAITLMMATWNNPKLLLLDEPTAALDPRSSAVVMTLADKIIRDHLLTAILVTHDVRQALTYGSRLLLMDRARIIRDVPIEEKKNLSMPVVQEWFYEAAR